MRACCCRQGCALCRRPPRPPRPNLLLPRSLPMRPRCAAEYTSCQNELITLRIANETNANAAGECQSHLADVERSYHLLA